MRKFFVFALALFLMVHSSGISLAKVVEGQRCTKIGKVKNVFGEELICVKAGKKALWKKKREQLVESIYVDSGISENVENCKLRDARSNKLQPNNVGFPMQEDIIPITGEINIIVIPVDFSDRDGGELPTAYLRDQSKRMADWYDFYSIGKVRLTFQIGEKWVRPNRPDSHYVVPKSQPNSQGLAVDLQKELAQDIVTAAGKQFDFSKSNVLFFYMPTVRSVDYDMGGRGYQLTTHSGTKNYFFWGGGAYHFDNRNLSATIKREKMWAFWIHEMLHSQGLALHAPANGSQTGLHTDQYGKSLVLDPWEVFRLNWVPNSAVICLDNEKMLNHKVVLKAIEYGSGKTRFSIVRLNQFEALLIESRRPIGYSQEWNTNQRGILVSRLDTRNDNDRSGESTSNSINSTKYSMWGYFINPDSKSQSGMSNFDIEDYLARVGDKFTYKDIVVKLISSGDFDLVEITNAK